MLEGDVSLLMLTEELREWGAEEWYWQIEQLSDKEFAVVFPSMESLRMVAKSASFTLPLFQTVIAVKEAVEVDRSLGALVDAWVLLEDIPVEMRNKAVRAHDLC